MDCKGAVSHPMAQVPALRHIFGVAQRDHQFVEELKDVVVSMRK